MAIPEAFLSRMHGMLQSEYPAFCEALNQPPFRGLRVNLLRCSAQAFAQSAPFALSPAPFAPEGFYIGEEVSGRHPWHHAGVFYLQEPSAMSVVTAAEIRPGMRVLDLCAAPGGKSTQAAAKLAGEGLLVSNEIIPSRARILLSNLERCGVRNAAVLNEKPERLCARLQGWFDVVLVDAPCSGEGMFRREPEAAAQWRPESPAENARRQLLILAQARLAVKEGGVLVYSTCTMSPEEDEGVVDAFLKENPDFTMEAIRSAFGRPAVPAWAGADPALSAARRIFPQDGGEGHFVARLRRTGEAPAAAVRPMRFTPPSSEQEKLFRAFYEGQFTGEPYGRPAVSGDRLTLLPEELPDLSGLSVLRAGVPAGTLRGARFEPSHALYLAAKSEEIRARCDLALEAPSLAAFLHGEEIEAPEGLQKGYAAIMAQGHAVGFGKVSEGVVKNHYPKGLRNV